MEADLTVVMQQYKYGNILNDADDYTKRKLVRDIQIHGPGKSNVTLLQRQDVLSVLHKQKRMCINIKTEVFLFWVEARVWRVLWHFVRRRLCAAERGW